MILLCFFLLMNRRPPRSTRTDTLFPYTTLFRSVIDAGDYNEREIVKMAMRIREHRASVVLSLESLELEAQMKCAATFLSTLFGAPRAPWYPALVVVDEAHMFAPVAAGEVR